MNKPQGSIWSDAQWEAIMTSGTNILVSAGAGSGKTAVLTERIIEKLKAGVSLKNLIVLTFTRASAFEMKERIRIRLIKEIEKGSIDENELALIDASHIETFDAFSLSLVKTYHYLLGVSSSINVADKGMMALEKIRIMDELTNKWIDNESFCHLLETYTLKNDLNLQNSLIGLYDSISLKPDIDLFLNEYFSSFFSNEEDIKKSYIELLKYQVKLLEESNTKMKKIALGSDYQSFTEDIYNAIYPLLSANTYEEFKIEIDYPRLPRSKDEITKALITKERDGFFKKAKEDFEKYTEYSSLDEALEEVLSTKEFVRTIVDLLKEFHLELTTFKKKNNLYGFNDIAQLAIKLIKEHDDLRNMYKSNINEILIDEYQDTSDIQEELMMLLSNDNLYMVGDIKQSIYRFRNANPAIFQKKYDEYSNQVLGKRIDLYQNFRSRKEVLDNINLIFDKIMDRQIGGIDYDDGQRLSFGNTAYMDIDNQSPNMEILEYQKDNNTVANIEANLIAKDIKEKVGKFIVFDKSEKRQREANYHDFVILTLDKSAYDEYIKVFDENHIPLVCSKGDAFLKSEEIMAIKNILFIISDYKKDNEYKASVIGVLRSFLYMISDEKIYDLCQGDFNVNFASAYPDIKEMFNELAAYQKNHSIYQILNRIYEKTDIYYKVIRIGNVKSSEAKLHYLLKQTNVYSQIGYHLNEFIEYLDGIMDAGYDFDFSPNLDDVKAVRIMTIHKSKGLEFPICYFPGMTKGFNLKDIRDSISFSNEFGILMPAFKEGLKKTILHNLEKYQYMNAEISEKIRLFYVALTRAREKMIFIVPHLENEALIGTKVTFSERVAYRSFMDILESLNSVLMPYKYLVEPVSSKAQEKIALPPSIDYEFKILESTLEAKEIEKRIGSALSAPLLDVVTKKIIDLGNKYHHAFEVLDFVNPDYSKVDKDIVENIKEFLNQPLLKQKYEHIYKEHQYSYYESGIIKKGIIDLVLEGSDELIIIDYKLSNIKEEYKSQILAYRDYLRTVSNKNIKAFLYRIMHNELVEVEL